MSILEGIQKFALLNVRDPQTQRNAFFPYIKAQSDTLES